MILALLKVQTWLMLVNSKVRCLFVREVKSIGDPEPKVLVKHWHRTQGVVFLCVIAAWTRT